MTGSTVLRASVLALATCAATGASAREARPDDGRCARYAAAWSDTLARFGRAGLGEAFLTRHDAFLASGCRAGREVCPRTDAERRIADALTVAAMNAGRASTFLPFSCRD